MDAVLSPATPESVGLSALRLARIDRFIERQYIEPGRLKGAQLLIARRGVTTTRRRGSS